MSAAAEPSVDSCARVDAVKFKLIERGTLAYDLNMKWNITNMQYNETITEIT